MAMQGLYDMTSNFISGVVTATTTSTPTPTHSHTHSHTHSPTITLHPVDFTHSTALTHLPPLTHSTTIAPIGHSYFLKLQHITGAPILPTHSLTHSLNNNDNDSFDTSTIIIPPNITPENIDQFTYYEILGLSTFGDSADRYIIRKAYHKAVLLYHPDKMHSHGHTEEQCRAIFLKVQAAADTLTDVSKRRAYDSMLDFDESIPTEVESKEASLAGIDAFLALYEPIFQRNARFALNKPVPSIGTAETRMIHINNFYSYWVKFDSWRDFTNVDREHDPEQAQCREHKRWMQKENEKNAKKLKKIEMARLNELVTRAMSHDPRIIAEKARVKAEKTAQKEERQRKIAQEEKEKAEKIHRQEEEKLNKIRDEKLEHERSRKQASKARNTFRKLLRLFSSLDAGVDGWEFGIMNAEDCDLFCQNTETSQLIELNSKLGGDGALSDPKTFVLASKAEVLDRLNAIKKSIEDKKVEELKQIEVRKKQHEKSAIESNLKKKGVNREWTGEEFSVLSKGVKKFPAGTRQRWVTICNYMNDLLKPDIPYEKEECLQASQNALKIMATLQNASTTKTSSVSTPVTTTTAPPTAAVVAKPLTSSAATPSTKKVERSAMTKSNQKTSEGDAEASEHWTQDQQKFLEGGLKKYPASMDKNERWTAIAGDIPGKNKKDWILRFKKLREELQAAKAKK